MPRPLILVSNDDGIQSEGIRALETALTPLGTVFVVAPENEQSATSHSMSLSRPLRLRQHGPRRFAVDGTPVDSVYVGLHHRELLPRRPDIVVSGINHGLNLGNDVFYSGTVAAAREGAMRGIPAIAVSLARHGNAVLAGAIARELARRVLAGRGRTRDRVPLLNVNVPAGRVRGLRATRLGERLYDDLVEIRLDPRGQQYLWIGGPTRENAPSPGTDTFAFEAGYASVTPLGLDLCDDTQLATVEDFVSAMTAPRATSAGATHGRNATKPARARRARRTP